VVAKMFKQLFAASPFVLTAKADAAAAQPAEVGWA
jgi:hypothetical protein